MKKIIILSGLLFAVCSYSQVENNGTEDLFGFKIGAVGAWINYEKSLTKKFTLNGEIGYEGGFLKGTDNDLDYIFTSTISLEPKYYYNILNRKSKNKNINKNAANYFGSEFCYVPNWLTSTNRNGVEVQESFLIVPKYGLRRSLSKKLSFEFAFGIGYILNKNSSDNITYVLDLRIHLN